MHKSSTTQRRIKQTRPFRSLSHEAVIALFRTANVLEAHFASRIEPFGLTPAQFNVLRILRGAGEPLPTMEIGERMVHRTPGITRLIDRLEASGLIRRERSTTDRRQVFCSITDAGRELLQKLDPAVTDFDDTILADLSRGQKESLIAILEAIQVKLD